MSLITAHALPFVPACALTIPSSTSIPTPSIQTPSIPTPSIPTPSIHTTSTPSIPTPSVPSIPTPYIPTLSLLLLLLLILLLVLLLLGIRYVTFCSPDSDRDICFPASSCDSYTKSSSSCSMSCS